MTHHGNNDIKFEDLVTNGTPNEPQPNQPPVWEVNNTQKKPVDTFSLVSMILGILSLVVCCCSPVNIYVVGCILSMACGIGAIVLYVLAKKKGTANGMAVAGLVCGIIGLVFALMMVLVYPAVEEILAEYMSMLESSMEL